MSSLITKTDFVHKTYFYSYDASISYHIYHGIKSSTNEIFDKDKFSWSDS